MICTAYQGKKLSYIMLQKAINFILKEWQINKIKAEPQTILNKNFEIGWLEGSISPIYLQREGKKVMSIKEFLRGFDLVVGDKLDE